MEALNHASMVDSSRRNSDESNSAPVANTTRRTTRFQRRMLLIGTAWVPALRFSGAFYELTRTMAAKRGVIGFNTVTRHCAISSRSLLFFRLKRRASCASSSISAKSPVRSAVPQSATSEASLMARSGRRTAAPRSPGTQRLHIDFLPLTPMASFLARQENRCFAVLRFASVRKRMRRRSPPAFRSPSRPRWARVRRQQITG